MPEFETCDYLLWVLEFGGRKNNINCSCVLLLECLVKNYDVAMSQCFYKKNKNKKIYIKKVMGPLKRDLGHIYLL